MTQAATIDVMGKRKNQAASSDTTGKTTDRHRVSSMLRFKLGLIYRLKRVAEENNREATREAAKVLWQHIIEEETRLGLAEITADEIRFLADTKSPLTDAEIEEIIKSAKDDAPKRFRKEHES